MLSDRIPSRREIIDRRALADAIVNIDGDDPSVRLQVVRLLKDALAAGRREIARRFKEKPYQGAEAASAHAWLADQLLRLTHDFVTGRLYPLGNPTLSERLTLVAVGGYGRAEMAPYSDIDVAFVTPWKATSWTEQVIEAILYLLWDLGLTIDHSTRSVDEMIRTAKSDHMVRTGILESRYVWGDALLHDLAMERFWSEVATPDSAVGFVAEKLAERDARHRRMGDSRYVVEPNVKEGKGGLRDLHTLFWIGKYVFRVPRVADLVDKGLLSDREFGQFRRAERFLLAVRSHLHLVAGRAEERLTFDYQREIAQRMRYAERAGQSSVERFMQHYFLHARTVGTLTGVFLAHLDEQVAARGRRFGLPMALRRPRAKLGGFVVDRGRLALPSDDFFATDPVRLIELFALADRHDMEIHPLAMRAAARDAGLIDSHVRRDPRANALFLDVLTSQRDPEKVLRWMNETGVFGRFIPDFGRVVAQMQFDMYHHYTVDEHTVRAVGLLARIERGELKDDHPLSTAIIRQIGSRRALYVAVLLHDIAKGRGGDHSVLGAQVAERLCPRLGLSAGETETVAWLVRHHLAMSATAFKRDLSDIKTIRDFAALVQGPDRLRLLLLLTVVDIRAVGPTVWNGWKRQLLAHLFEAAEEVLRLGHKQRGRKERIASSVDALRLALGWSADKFETYRARLPDTYLIAEPADVLESNARLIAASGDSGDGLGIDVRPYPDAGATLVTVSAADHPGLFYRLAGAIHLAGGNIIDARVHTTNDGRAIDNFLVQNSLDEMIVEPARLERLRRAIAETLAGRTQPSGALASAAPRRPRADAFAIEPIVLIDNRASNHYSVIEVAARDRPALLYALAFALFRSKITIHSAHIATYGERAVDTFYVADLAGGKITRPQRLKALERRLLEAAGAPQEGT